MPTSPVQPIDSPAPADASDQSANAPGHASSRVDIAEKPALAAGSGPALLALLLMLALTAATTALAAAAGAWAVRVHEVPASRDAVRTASLWKEAR